MIRKVSIRITRRFLLFQLLLAHQMSTFSRTFSPAQLNPSFASFSHFPSSIPVTPYSDGPTRPNYTLIADIVFIFSLSLSLSAAHAGGAKPRAFSNIISCQRVFIEGSQTTITKNNAQSWSLLAIYAAIEGRRATIENSSGFCNN